MKENKRAATDAKGAHSQKKGQSWPSQNKFGTKRVAK